MKTTMAASMFAVFLCVVVLGQSAAGSLLFDVNPANISPGTTSSLTVNCSFAYDGVPAVSNIASLTISKDGQQLAAVDESAPDQVKEPSQTNASVSAYLATNQESFLCLQWTFPTSSLSGVYNCEANVMDSNGQTSDIPATAQVTSSQPDIAQLMNVLTNVQTKLTTWEPRVLKLEGQNQMELRVHEALFQNSSVYNGKYYMLYNQELYHANVSEVYCEYWGGYLAEIDDAGENDFITDFLKSFQFEYEVLLGGTDEAQKGEWVYRHSGRPVVYSNWGTEHPEGNGPDYDCMTLLRTADWTMQAMPCYTGAYFLCEIPVNSSVSNAVKWH